MTVGSGVLTGAWPIFAVYLIPYQMLAWNKALWIKALPLNH
jgi:hypothetical protein